MNMNQSFINESELQKLQDYLVRQKPKLIILTHANPDGDAVGSSLGLFAGLKSLGVDVSVACLDPVPDAFHFIPFEEHMKSDFDEKSFDAVCFVDCGSRTMTRFEEDKPRILSGEMIKINIDHHPSNDSFGDINFVVTHASSSTQIIFHLLQGLRAKITPQIATCLLLGLYTDTGSFMHQNTTSATYDVAGQLLRLGANASQIAKKVFQSHEPTMLKLWSRVLQNLYLTPEGAAIVGVSRKDYESLGAKREDLTGVIDFINSMPEAKYSVLLSEDEKGNVKASLRTRKQDVDVKALAEQFGGGGHIKASGFMVKGGHLQKEIKWKIIQD